MIEIESLVANPQYTVLLSYFNSSSGVLPIINKLPYNLVLNRCSAFVLVVHTNTKMTDHCGSY
jgi:hypothetical protein